MSIRICILLILLWTAFGGCRSGRDASILPEYDFIPVETGRYTIYDVQETQYTRNTPPVQRTYRLKETIGPAYNDVTGQPAYRLLRYRRISDDQPWQPDSIWSVRLVNNEVIRTENGQDFVKLLYPASDGLIWNGNRYNVFKPNRYEARNVGQPFSVSGKEFRSTITVVAQDDSTLIGQTKRVDVYAHQIGMIYKERTYLQFCTDLPTCLGKNQIDYGIRQIYRIQTYGKE
ncbi:hypothetical protein [Spirosoma fluviale]|uniref:Lipoprotein n=1 Tax=Spirosoma fluviale TaxID=1597977 RepID=A0A286FCG8_9BACT|nr:hypothetical protein [Spirosoma fluviale]SOD80786.1 hypothetical protein SAMN06269250_1566 [Spirosoma fluviale]